MNSSFQKSFKKVSKIKSFDLPLIYQNGKTMIITAAHPQTNALNAIEKAVKKIENWRKSLPLGYDRKKYAKSVSIMNRLIKEHAEIL